jgi:UDP-glucuronate 4-epimerase
MQPGDVPDTYADVSELVDAIAYQPKTNIYEGVKHYVAWYRNYYRE